MSEKTRWSTRALGGALALVVLIVMGAMLAGSALATGSLPKKEYTATITAVPSIAEDDVPGDAPAEAWAGSTPTVTITLTNQGFPHWLGSANISVPAGVTILPSSLSLTSNQNAFVGKVSESGGVIKLRNLYLAPTKSVTVSVGVQNTCAPTAPSYAFTTSAKQVLDFAGSTDYVLKGSQPALDLVGACSLAFRTQPADAQRATGITSEPYLPTGAPVTVAVLDGSGSADVAWWTAPIDLGIGTNPGGGTLSGTTSATPASSVASFLPQIDKSASGYTLTASSSGIAATAPVSSPFAIVDSGQRCVAGQTCTGTTSAPKTTATVSGIAGTNDLLTVSLGAPTTPAYTCVGYTTTTEILDFNLTSLTGGTAGGVKTAAFTLLKAFVTRPASAYEACFASPLPFVTKSGAPAPKVGDVYVGLLPSCSSGGGGDEHKGSDCTVGPPCVLSKVKDRYGNVTLTITAPPGDPRVKF